MFSELHQGSTLYLLDKGTLTIKVAQVQNVGFPKPMLSQPFGLNNTSIDVVAVTNGETINLPGLSSNLSSTTVNGIIVSETREALDAEIDGIQRELQSHVDNRDEYIRSIERCKEVRKELNPKLAEEQKQKERIEKLEKSLAVVQSGQEELKEMLIKALDAKKEQP